jgi:hypothetical protein
MTLMVSHFVHFIRSLTSLLPLRACLYLPLQACYDSARREVNNLKMNIDCIRDVLLELESFPMGCYVVDSFEQSIRKHGKPDVVYSLMKLAEAEYINANYVRTMDGRPHITAVFDMTFRGHEFLEKIRSDTIWSTNIKPILSSIGSISFDAITQIASSVITSLISARLGLNA